jgi:hypothetical protein
MGPKVGSPSVLDLWCDGKAYTQRGVWQPRWTLYVSLF